MANIVLILVKHCKRMACTDTESNCNSLTTRNTIHWQVFYSPVMSGLHLYEAQVVASKKEAIPQRPPFKTHAFRSINNVREW